MASDLGIPLYKIPWRCRPLPAPQELVLLRSTLSFLFQKLWTSEEDGKDGRERRGKRHNAEDKLLRLYYFAPQDLLCAQPPRVTYRIWETGRQLWDQEGPMVLSRVLRAGHRLEGPWLPSVNHLLPLPSFLNQLCGLIHSVVVFIRCILLCGFY